MSRKMTAFALAAMASASFAGCAHFTHVIMRGSVAEVEGPDEAQVCLGNNEVKVGDKVTLFNVACKGPAIGRAGIPACRKERIGEGTVTRTLNEHMSIVKVEPGVAFKEGTIVEKK